MRLRRFVTKNDCAVVDFDNNQHTAVILVGTIRNGSNRLLPTHKLKNGRHYRVDLVSLDGVPALKMSARNEAGDKSDPNYFPADCLKFWQEWTKADEAEETELLAEWSAAKAAALAKAGTAA